MNATPAPLSAADLTTAALQWHRGVSAIPLEGFQSWALTGLKAHIPFDHALWGLGAGVEEDNRAFINSVHLHRIAPQIMVDYEAVRHMDPLAQATTAAPGRVVNLCMADAPWQTEPYRDVLAHVRRYGLMNVLCLSYIDARSEATQFITLARADENHRFSANEAQAFELLGPHVMQAFTTRRELSVATAPGRKGQPVVWSTAIIDAAGTVHDADASFTQTLQREWAAWPGKQLPEPLREVLSRRDHKRWRFAGQQVLAEFSPINDLYLVAIRPRAANDLLSERERKVARHYAAGSSHKEIAQIMQVSPATVRAHVRNVFLKLGVSNKARLATLLD